MKTRGFSLVELMIVIAILGILMAVALPSLRSYLAANRVRATAESFIASVSQAKAEAATRNTQIEVLLTASGPADVTTAVPTAGAPGWMVRPADASEYIDGKLLVEDGQSNVSIAGVPESVIFTPLGGTTLSTLAPPVAVATFTFSSPGDGDCLHAAPPGPVRCMVVRVTATGRTKLCDPLITLTAPNDPRACT